MLSHRNTKFLFFFYQFNQYLAQIGKPLKLIRHTVIEDDNYSLTGIQEENGSILLKFCWNKAFKQQKMEKYL